MRIKWLKIHRVSSWVIVALALLTIILGYISSNRLLSPYIFWLTIHVVIVWMLVITSIFHVILSLKYLKLKVKRMIERIKSEKAVDIHLLRLIQRITSWGILIFSTLVIISGLKYYQWFAVIFGDFFLFSWHLNYDLLLAIFVILHVVVGSKFYLTRKKIRHWGADLLIILLGISSVITVLIINAPPRLPPFQVRIDGVNYSFNPDEIDTVRPDLFQNGSYSPFDVLLHLNSTGKLNMTYHFNSTLDTYVIDSLNGKPNYWYHAYYSGGYIEPNVVRIDHFPWKPGTTLIMYEESPSHLNHMYSTFAQETVRLATNNGTIVIPTVTINGSSFDLEFYNITVTAHDMRNDVFQNGTITALDVIMTLGDLGYLTYELKFFTTLQTAGYIYTYFVQKINSDETVGRCGFLYEVGDTDFKFPGPNYIFIGADTRILTSPEYLRFFWGCL
ncbi:MAG: hypothetical protein ACXADU_00725 [Promethearchaeota archaeon]